VAAPYVKELLNCFVHAKVKEYQLHAVNLQNITANLLVICICSLCAIIGFLCIIKPYQDINIPFYTLRCHNNICLYYRKRIKVLDSKNVDTDFTIE